MVYSVSPKAISSLRIHCRNILLRRIAKAEEAGHILPQLTVIFLSLAKAYCRQGPKYSVSNLLILEPESLGFTAQAY